MTTSYETTELISSHHAEIDRLSNELLELGSRIAAHDREASVLRERARALCWRLREHLSTESAALIADAYGDSQRIAQVMTRCHEGHARIERGLAETERDSLAPLELVRAVCAVARDSRAHLDRAAHAA
jgi:hypothetical protein